MSNAIDQAQAQYETICELLEGVAAAGSNDDALEIAINAIYEHPLSVEVRSGWQISNEPLVQDEYRILLCSGGPAVHITGALDGDIPVTAYLQYQDWGTP